MIIFSMKLELILLEHSVISGILMTQSVNNIIDGRYIFKCRLCRCRQTERVTTHGRRIGG